VTARFTLTLAPAGREIAVAEGQSLLEAVLAAGVKLPWSCRNGTCRECRAWLLDGEVRYRVDWPGLLAEERAEGWVLPCVADALSDVVLQPRCPGAD